MPPRQSENAPKHYPTGSGCLKLAIAASPPAGPSRENILQGLHINNPKFQNDNH
jgi:hypothetical protein